MQSLSKLGPDEAFVADLIRKTQRQAMLNMLVPLLSLGIGLGMLLSEIDLSFLPEKFYIVPLLAGLLAGAHLALYLRETLRKEIQLLTGWAVMYRSSRKPRGKGDA